MIDGNLALDIVRVTEAAALAASALVGRGDEAAADRAAAEAMRAALDALPIDGTIVIGMDAEGDAPFLLTGEKVGTGQGPRLDIALDPLEGTTITAKGGPNALAIVAVGEAGAFLSVPHLYMDKIALGAGLPGGLAQLEAAPQDNLVALARAKGVGVSDLVVCVLDRPRHQRLIGDIRAAGARIMQISDGDAGAVIATARPMSGVDIVLGSGGAAQGVLAAAAMRCLGGQMQGRLLVRDEDERARARASGIEDLDRIYDLTDLARGAVLFAATGVTDGTILRGVRRFRGGAATNSLVTWTGTGTVRVVETTHRLPGGTPA